MTSEFYNDAYNDRLEDQVERMRQEQLRAMRSQPEADVMEQVKIMATQASSAQTMKCLHGEPVFYWPYTKGLVPGHIYSEAGIAEARISGCCEYHFDSMFPDSEDDGPIEDVVTDL